MLEKKTVMFINNIAFVFILVSEATIHIYGEVVFVCARITRVWFHIRLNVGFGVELGLGYGILI